MRQWIVLFKKEWTESVRSYKILWIPVVFILLGITQPVTSYYFADIIGQFGGLPEGAVMDIPIPTGAEVITATLGQFGQIGFLVLVLAYMGIVAKEKNHGTQILVLVKPVSYTNYLTAKWAHLLCISLGSYAMGYIAAVYYTFLLIEKMVIADLIYGGIIYGIWIAFVMTVILCLSALLNSTAFVAFAGLGLTVVLSLLSSLTPDLMTLSPAMLTSHSQNLYQTGQVGSGFGLNLAFTLVLIIGILIGTIYLFHKKEIAQHTT
ncbi:ABC transporter permease [Salipaludibacillus neizhouensis]|uniref:ABC transporter permease n=2 Tax=Salipaludibacillus neizhouensis TaxID=885475 RepID=A0A3A9JWZ5_9BACI|nr:ABC transporter permease [Salipaludibacillus neizhouensis]